MKSLTCKQVKSKTDSISYSTSIPPSPAEGFVFGSQLIFADGGLASIPFTLKRVFKNYTGRTMMRPFRWFENNDAGAGLVISFFRTPLFIKKIYAFVLRYIYRDPLTADLIAGSHEKTAEQTWSLVSKRELYRARWFEAWKEHEIDFLLTVPNACPAIPLNGMKNSVTSVGYTFLFNIVSNRLVLLKLFANNILSWIMQLVCFQ